MHQHTTVMKGAAGLLAAGAGIGVSTLESVKLVLQVSTAGVSLVVAILTLLSMARSFRRNRDDQ